MRLERHLPDPPAVVWAAITNRDELRSWFPCDVEVAGGRWEVGAAIVFRFSPDVTDLTLSGEVLAVDQPHLLSFTWGEEVLRFELSPHGIGCLDDGSPGIGIRGESPPMTSFRHYRRRGVTVNM